ncbi:hypothetical protein ACIBBE_23980 [Streptomyces sp. NPDC051644]|uniref:hypothetical protein n=1 Tax=Streptomyces sp. NPDC051644 TaxID=3365666 RepID=UPI0037A4B4FE
MLTNETPFPLGPDFEERLIRNCKDLLMLSTGLRGDEYQAFGKATAKDANSLLNRIMAGLGDGHHVIAVAMETPSKLRRAAGCAVDTEGRSATVDGNLAACAALISTSLTTDTRTIILTRSVRTAGKTLVNGWYVEYGIAAALNAQETRSEDAVNVFTGAQRDTDADVYGDGFELALTVATGACGQGRPPCPLLAARARPGPAHLPHLRFPDADPCDVFRLQGRAGAGPISLAPGRCGLTCCPARSGSPAASRRFTASSLATVLFSGRVCLSMLLITPVQGPT